jgi:small subunit ribosomal protein S12
MIYFFTSLPCFFFKIILLLFNFRLIYLNTKKKKYKKTEGNSFVRGSVIRATAITPRKPNSARRAIVKLLLTNKISALSYIPGIGHNLRKHSLVLIRGGGARDLPMVNYSCVRGKYDLNGVMNRITRRSIYGVKKNKESFILKRKLKKF